MPWHWWGPALEVHEIITIKCTSGIRESISLPLLSQTNYEGSWRRIENTANTSWNLRAVSCTAKHVSKRVCSYYAWSMPRSQFPASNTGLLPLLQAGLIRSMQFPRMISQISQDVTVEFQESAGILLKLWWKGFIGLIFLSCNFIPCSFKHLSHENRLEENSQGRGKQANSCRNARRLETFSLSQLQRFSPHHGKNMKEY